MGLARPARGLGLSGEASASASASPFSLGLSLTFQPRPQPHLSASASASRAALSPRRAGNAGFIVQRRAGGAADFENLVTYESFAPLKTKGVQVHSHR